MNFDAEDYVLDWWLQSTCTVCSHRSLHCLVSLAS